ncbi:MAG: hypothetical protein ABIY52_14720 [Gemmatimonadaceae bacterium]
MVPSNPHRIIDVDGRRWVVSPVIEGQGWDAELPVRRENWLSFEADGERRFITPLPHDWETWPEDELRARLLVAPRSLRRSFGA